MKKTMFYASSLGTISELEVIHETDRSWFVRWPSGHESVFEKSNMNGVFWTLEDAQYHIMTAEYQAEV